MEEKYWELREAVDRAYDNCCAHNTAENHIIYIAAKQTYVNFCVEVLEKLMEENSDVLKRLKEC
jgi:hypothetical protein